MDLHSDTPQDGVCVLVFARSPAGADALRDSDTTLLVMGFRDELTIDSSRVELVLRAQ
jgi:hypothetical protein